MKSASYSRSEWLDGSSTLTGGRRLRSKLSSFQSAVSNSRNSAMGKNAITGLADDSINYASRAVVANTGGRHCCSFFEESHCKKMEIEAMWVRISLPRPQASAKEKHCFEGRAGMAV